MLGHHVVVSGEEMDLCAAHRVNSVSASYSCEPAHESHSCLVGFSLNSVTDMSRCPHWAMSTPIG